MVLKILLPALTIITAWLGGLSTFYTDWSWYESLNKATYNPPNYLFGIVWPILYTMMGVVSYFNAKHIYKLYILQLVLNGSWSWIFFAHQAPDLAFINIAALIAVNVLIIKKLWLKRSFLSFIGYVPYLFWLLFASYLNISISVLN